MPTSWPPIAIFSSLMATTISPRLTPSRAAGDLLLRPRAPPRPRACRRRCRALGRRRATDWRPCSRSSGWRPGRSRTSRGGSSTGAISVMVVFTGCPLRTTPSSVDAADALGDEAVLEALRILHLLAVHAHHHVAREQAGACRRALGMDLGDQRARRRVEAERVGDIGRDASGARRRATAAAPCRP